MTFLFNMVTPPSRKNKKDDPNICFMIFRIIKTYGLSSNPSFVVKLSSSDRPSE